MAIGRGLLPDLCWQNFIENGKDDRWAPSTRSIGISWIPNWPSWVISNNPRLAQIMSPGSSIRLHEESCPDGVNVNDLETGSRVHADGQVRIHRVGVVVYVVHKALAIGGDSARGQRS
ncbi:uncharacterized protein LOC120417844 [Culex pipiens pallens]|uniref:uncharacterized protein LOC120417844 n=1 Tax=Culex pipiens pallens TaxID=42434 RepID=UPI001952FA32|nr:uncharacterized protein LOC120417844 [Culex pipiens pallens]